MSETRMQSQIDAPSAPPPMVGTGGAVNPFAPEMSAAPPSVLSSLPKSNQEVSGIGKWVFNHQLDFSKNSPLAWYGIRNVLNNVVSIFGLMATIVPVRMAMGHTARWAEGKGHTKLQNFMSHTILQNSIGVGVSFSTFRTLYKMGQRAYDRVFIDPTTPEEASKAVADLPKNWWNDFKQIAPAEYPATMLASFALVGIRSAITGGPPEAAGNYWKDIAGCALVAYPVFFEATEHLSRDFQIARGYNDTKTNEHFYKDQQSLSELLTRQIPGIAAGIIPYIAFNTNYYRTTKRQLSYNANQLAAGHKEIDGFRSAFWKERPYQLFWMFSLGRDLYFDLYDKITGHQEKTERTGMVSPAHPATQIAHANRQGTVQLDPRQHAVA